MAGRDRPSDEGVDDLLLLLGFVFKQRKRILPWITELDRVDRDGWDRGDDDRWAFFAIAFWPRGVHKPDRAEYRSPARMMSR